MTDREYYLIQYTSDPFRKETVNVGLLFVADGRLLAKFIAERESGSIDGQAALRKVKHPSVFKDWVDFWREESLDGEDGLKRILESTKGSYHVIHGGNVFGDPRPVEEVVADVFNRLVVDPNHALRPDGGHRLSTAIKRELERLNLMKRVDSSSLALVKHPVEYGRRIRGRVAEHEPTFVQENGIPYFMHAVEFSDHSTKAAIHDRAAATAYMFGDLRDSFNKCETVSIVHNPPSIRDQLKNALSMMRDKSRVIDWNDEEQRDEFVRERLAVAESA